jgi:hypothetical protein
LSLARLLLKITLNSSHKQPKIASHKLIKNSGIIAIDCWGFVNEVIIAKTTKLPITSVNGSFFVDLILCSIDGTIVPFGAGTVNALFVYKLFSAYRPLALTDRSICL